MQGKIWHMMKIHSNISCHSFSHISMSDLWPKRLSESDQFLFNSQTCSEWITEVSIELYWWRLNLWTFAFGKGTTDLLLKNHWLMSHSFSSSYEVNHVILNQAWAKKKKNSLILVSLSHIVFVNNLNYIHFLYLVLTLILKL